MSASTDPIARHVKLADLADNLANNRRQEPTADIGTRIERYEKARRRLLSAPNIYTIGMIKVMGVNAMVAQRKRMTVEEFMALPDDGNRHELVRGEVRVTPLSKGEHGFVETAITAAIGRYLYDRAITLGWEPRQGLGARNRLVGRVGGGELGLRFAVPDDPSMVRGADGVYVPPAQLAEVAWDGREYFPAVPALVIEVISATDRADQVNEKIQDYLVGGARRVWCVYPEQRRVHIHDAQAPVRVVSGEDSLTDDDLLPGFALPLNLVFAEP